MWVVERFVCRNMSFLTISIGFPDPGAKVAGLEIDANQPPGCLDPQPGGRVGNREQSVVWLGLLDFKLLLEPFGYVAGDEGHLRLPATFGSIRDEFAA